MQTPVFLAACSPRHGGNSDFAASLLRSCLPGAGPVRRIADEKVRPCISCGYCAAHPGECSLDGPHDGARALFQAMCQAPLSVIVSPVYFYHLPAQAKAWVDRSQRFWACAEKPGRGHAVTAVLFGARLRGEKLFEGAERTLRYMALALGLEWVEPLRLYGLDGPGDLAAEKEACERIRAYAAELSHRGMPVSIVSDALSESLLHRAGNMLRSLGLGERRCTVCGEPFDPERLSGTRESLSVESVLRALLCPRCRKEFRRREAEFCPYCGEPSALEDAPCMPCQQCLETLPPWRDFLFFGVYRGALRELLLQAKFGGSPAALDMLGHLLAAVCVEHYAVSSLPDAVIPMPLDRDRLQTRGFNQCRELVRPVARALGVPVRLDVLVKTQTTPPQESMGREQRRQLKQPFISSCRVDGLHLLLVDDVCTTGATLDRAVRCLLEAGATRVDVAVLARASRHEPASGGHGDFSALP